MGLLKRTIAVGALVAASVLGLAACGSSDSASGEVVGTVERGPTTEVTQAGDDLRVVALGWSDGEIALSLGVTPVAIYDWQGHGEDNKGVGPWAKDAAGDADIEVIKNTGTTYNYEQIELLEPDVILNVRASGDSEVFDRLAQIAPVAAAPTGTGDFAVDWATQTTIIGTALGKDDEAAEQIDETKTAIADAKEANPQFAGKTFTYGVKFGDAYGAYLPGDARFDVFQQLGFTQFPAVKDLDSNGFFASVPVERVAALDSDVAVLSTIAMPLADLTGDSLISSLSVVKDKRALLLDEADETNVALAAGTPQSIRHAIERVTPELAKLVPPTS